MSQTSERRSQWLRRGAEGLTIVVSILLALFAEAAWNYRGDRIEERQLLEGLSAEFAEAALEVESDLAARDEILDRTDALLRARQASGAPPDKDSVPGLVSALLDWRFYTPAHAVLDDALSSGRLELIRSQAVRGSLMIYVQERDRLPIFDRLERDFVTLQMEPYLAERVALDRLSGRSASQQVVADESERFLRLLSDDHFGSLLEIRAERTRQAVIFARITRRAIADVQQAIDDAAGG